MKTNRDQVEYRFCKVFRNESIFTVWKNIRFQPETKSRVRGKLKILAFIYLNLTVALTLKIISMMYLNLIIFHRPA